MKLIDKEAYRDYRKRHGIYASWTLATPFQIWYGLYPVILGFIGAILWVTLSHGATLPGRVTPGSVPSIPAARPTPPPAFHSHRGHNGGGRTIVVPQPYTYSYSNNHGASVVVIDNFKSHEYDLNAVYPFGRKIESKWHKVHYFETPDETAERDAEWRSAGRTTICFKCNPVKVRQ